MAAPPDNGSKTIGNKAVAAIGRASDSHHVAIHKVEANTAFASSLNP